MNPDTKQAVKVVLAVVFFILAWSYASHCDMEIINLQNK